MPTVQLELSVNAVVKPQVTAINVGDRHLFEIEITFFSLQNFYEPSPRIRLRWLEQAEFNSGNGDAAWSRSEMSHSQPTSVMDLFPCFFWEI